MKPAKIIAFLILCLHTAAYAADRRTSGSSKWNVEKSDHFIVYYRDAPAEDVTRINEYAERYYHNITEELGFTRFEDFWTWDVRVKIHLYNTRSEYIKETKRSEWSAAHINVITRDLYAYLDMANFLDVILPH